jgi:hypothetical protein
MTDFKFNWEGLKEEADPASDCKGLFFRGYQNLYVSQYGEVHTKQGIKFLKRKSCKGCHQCSFIIDSMKECPDSVIMPKIVQSHLYSIRVTNQCRDWETGYIDDYDIEVFEVKDV